MPDVVNAYKEMGARIADIDRLREAVGCGEETRACLVVREGTLPRQTKTSLAMEITTEIQS